MRIAYLVSEYPKASHSFIRREILALERKGFEVLRVALRGWHEGVPDEADQAERERTYYLLKGGFVGLALATVRVALLSPLRFLYALWLCLRASRGSDRAWVYHLAYLAESCCLQIRACQHGVRHIHAHFGTNAAEIAMLAGVLCRLPFSFTVHGTAELDRLNYLGLGEKVRRARSVVATSAFMRCQLYRVVPHALWGKIHVVRCGLEEAFHEIADRSPAATPRLVCVGRLSEEKGKLLLVEAAHRLIASGVAFELVLAGDGPLRPVVEQMIAECGLTAKVTITGWISSAHVRQEIQAARGLVLPSFAEGLPVVLMEAMALRRPVIATAVGGIAELVRPGTDGWLVPAGSVSALSAAMRELIGLPTDRLRAMGNSARAWALECHSIDVESEKLARLFEQATA